MWGRLACIAFGLHVCSPGGHASASIDFPAQASAFARRLNDKLQELGYPAIGRLTLHPSTLRDEGELKAWVEQRLEPFLEEQVTAHVQQRTIEHVATHVSVSSPLTAGEGALGGAQAPQLTGVAVPGTGCAGCG